MKRNLTLSFQKKKRLKNLPEIHTSNINLSINNTFVLIRNNTQNNLSLTQNNNLPNIFSNNSKKNKIIFSPFNSTKTKKTTNVHTITLKKQNSETSDNEISPMFELMTSKKILGRFLYYFNIRELLILMNINKKINTFVKNTEVFKKYINIKSDILKGNLFKDTKKEIIFRNFKYNFRNNSKNISYQLTTESNLSNFSNNNNNQRINNFLKYNLLTKNKIKLTKIINPKITSNIFSFKLLQNYNKGALNLKKGAFTNSHFDSSRNSLFSFQTGSSKNKTQTKDKIQNNDIEFKINNLNLQSLKLKLLSLIKNNGQKIIFLMKKYKLNFIESKLIFNGIIESYILKSMKENQISLDSLILQKINPEKFLDFYLDPLLNLDLFKVRKINFDNVILSSLLITRKLVSLISRNLENLKILSLQNNNINDRYAKLLFISLKYNQNLSILNLNQNQISSRGIIYLDSFLKNNDSLNTLVLSYNYLGSSGSNILMKILKENENSNLKTLDISYNGIDESGIESLVDYIKINKKLISLFFSGNYFCDKGLNLFSKLLFKDNQNVKKVKLSYLDISNNSFTKNSCKHINNILYFSSFISSINISYNNLCNEGIYNIFSCINKQSKLISLDLSKTNISEKTVEFLCDKLDNNIILRILNLSNNNLSKACKYLKNLLLKETNLKVLKIISCQISLESNLIFQGLSNNKGLQTLDISCNYLYFDSTLLNDLYNFFKNNKKLNNLIMDNNNIDDTSMNYISQFIEVNQCLKIISLKNNKITNQSTFSLINSLQKNDNLRKIGLEGNPIDSDIKQQIYIFINEKLNINKNAF